LWDCLPVRQTGFTQARVLSLPFLPAAGRRNDVKNVGVMAPKGCLWHEKRSSFDGANRVVVKIQLAID